MTQNKTPLLLIDGSNMFYRSFFAVKYSKEANIRPDVSGGMLEMHVFFKGLLADVADFFPGVVIVCWDDGYDFRKGLYPDYKEFRKSKKDLTDQKRQILFKSMLKETFAKLGILSITIKGVEADDIVAYFCKHFGKRHPIHIFSNDSDLSQFPYTMYHDLKGHVSWVTKAKARKIVLEKIICGDSSDGIKGIRGIGPVRCKTLLKSAGFTYEGVVGCFAEEPDQIEILERNKKLIDLLFMNDVVMDKKAEHALYKVMHDYCSMKFAQLAARTQLSKMRLMNVLDTMPISFLGENNAATSSFCRSALQVRSNRRAQNYIAV